jgi:hypothetical protein
VFMDAARFTAKELKQLQKWPRRKSAEVEQDIIVILKKLSASPDDVLLNSMHRFHIRLARTLRKAGR